TTGGRDRHAGDSGRRGQAHIDGVSQATGHPAGRRGQAAGRAAPVDGRCPAGLGHPAAARRQCIILAGSLRVDPTGEPTPGHEATLEPISKSLERSTRVARSLGKLTRNTPSELERLSSIVIEASSTKPRKFEA